jgi:hypothetical protein
MTATTHSTLLTSDEYIATGDTRSRWTELIDGQVFVTNPRGATTPR